MTEIDDGSIGKNIGCAARSLFSITRRTDWRKLINIKYIRS